MRRRFALLVTLATIVSTSTLADDPSAPDCSHLKNTANIDATIILDITVAVDGSVKDAKIAQSSGNNDLDQITATCAKVRWHYKPAMQSGVPIEAHTKARVVWKSHS